MVQEKNGRPSKPAKPNSVKDLLPKREEGTPRALRQFFGDRSVETPKKPITTDESEAVKPDATSKKASTDKPGSKLKKLSLKEIFGENRKKAVPVPQKVFEALTALRKGFKKIDPVSQQGTSNSGRKSGNANLSERLGRVDGFVGAPSGRPISRSPPIGISSKILNDMLSEPESLLPETSSQSGPSTPLQDRNIVPRFRALPPLSLPSGSAAKLDVLIKRYNFPKLNLGTRKPGFFENYFPNFYKIATGKTGLRSRVSNYIKDKYAKDISARERRIRQKQQTEEELKAQSEVHASTRRLLSTLSGQIDETPATEDGVRRALNTAKELHGELKEFVENTGLESVRVNTRGIALFPSVLERNYRDLLDIHGAMMEKVRLLAQDAGVSQTRLNDLAEQEGFHPDRTFLPEKQKTLLDRAFSTAKTTNRAAKTAWGESSLRKAWSHVRDFSRQDLVSQAVDDVSEAGKTPEDLLEDRTAHVLRNVSSALAGLSLHSSETSLPLRPFLPSVDRILDKGKVDVLRLHLSSNQEVISPDLSLFEQEGLLARTRRRVANQFTKTTKQEAPTFTDSFWSNYSGRVIETRKGQYVLIPSKPPAGKNPLFIDVLTGKNIFNTLQDPHIELNLLYGKSNAISRVHGKYSDYLKLISRVQRLKR